MVRYVALQVLLQLGWLTYKHSAPKQNGTTYALYGECKTKMKKNPLQGIVFYPILMHIKYIYNIYIKTDIFLIKKYACKGETVTSEGWSFFGICAEVAVIVIIICIG